MFKSRRWPLEAAALRQIGLPFRILVFDPELAWVDWAGTRLGPLEPDSPEAGLFSGLSGRWAQ